MRTQAGHTLGLKVGSYVPEGITENLSSREVRLLELSRISFS